MSTAHLDEVRCELTDLPESWCACRFHLVASDEPDGEDSEPSRSPIRAGYCLSCGKPLYQGQTVAANFCSWMCSW